MLIISGRCPRTSHASVSDPEPSTIGDAAAPDHVHHVVRADHARGVLVDAHPEQARVLGDEREQPSEPVPLLEVLVDDHAREQPESGRDLGHALLGRGAARAERDHVAAHRARAGAGAGDRGTGLEPIEDRVGEARAADRRREAQLVAAGQEDAARVADRDGRRVGVRLRPGDDMQRADATRAELAEHDAVALAGLGAERRRGADDGDRGVGATGEGDEPAQDQPVADLVLGATDDDDGSFRHTGREYPTAPGPLRHGGS